MATLNPSLEGSSGERSSGLSLSLLGTPLTWLGAAAVGAALVFVGLFIDAYRHNNGAGGGELVSWSSPGMVVAGAGAALAAIGILTALSILALRDAPTVETAFRRGAVITLAWIGVAVAATVAVTYASTTGLTLGHEGHAATGGATTTSEDDDGAAAPAPSDDAAASDEHAHDQGEHATFTQLNSLPDAELRELFPEGTVSPSELVVLRGQVRQVRQVALQFPTAAAASAGGYFNATADITAMGQHWINMAYMTDGLFDPEKPEGLLFSKVDGGEPKLVGVWFLQLPGSGGSTEDAPPEGFASQLDVWHGHAGICLGNTTASEDTSEAGCTAGGGRFIEDARWMMHVWVAPETAENSAGFFAYLNEDLAARQVASVPLEQGDDGG